MRVNSIKPKLTLKDVRAAKKHSTKNVNPMESFKTIVVTEEDMTQQRNKLVQKSAQMREQLCHTPFKKRLENFIDKIIDIIIY